MIDRKSDIIVIGGGIAGVSAAAELASSATVILLEAEDQAGFHATGRSAAYFAAAYGNEVVRGITAASEKFFREPPDGFSESALIRPRDCIFVGREDQRLSLDNMAREIPSLSKQSVEQVCTDVPIFRDSYLFGALRESNGGDLDVDAVLQGYLRLYKRRGGEIRTGSRVDAIGFKNGIWTISCGNSSYSANKVVNASGAWVDHIAELAGLGRLGIVPKRRTAILIDAPEGRDIEDWPLIIDADEEFYFKPDAGQLLISPANEDKSVACDAQAEEIDIAIAVDRFMTACDVNVKRINHSWAGLRTFANDKSFVVGFDPRAEGFYWLAGQGGYGVQSAPGLAKLAAYQILDSPLTCQYADIGRLGARIAPDRLIN